MNYELIYNTFIESRKALNKTRTLALKNVHHIMPVILGGETTSDNLIELTFKEHLFAHAVLFKMYKLKGNDKAALSMLYALCKLTYLPRSSMTFKKALQHGLKFHEQRYTKYFSNLSELMKGKNNPNYGHKWTDALKKKASNRKKKWLKEHNNWNPMDVPEYRKKISIKNSGLRNGNGRKYKVVMSDKTEYIITPPVKKNVKLATKIDYQQFYLRIDLTTRYAPKYDAYLIELPKTT